MKKKLVCYLTGMVAVVAALGLASAPAGVLAEEPNPRPSLNNVPVRLCTESSNDPDNIYCGPGEVIAEQVSITRIYPLNGGGQIALPGTFQFTSSTLNQGIGDPRAVVFGPIYGPYAGYTASYLWGTLWRNGILGGGNYISGIPTELFTGGLGNPGTGLDLSYTAQYNLEYAFQPLAWFGSYPHYVVLYLDVSPPGHPYPHPGLGVLTTLDGQVWGREQPPF